MHAAPKSHGQARPLAHQPRGLLVAEGLWEWKAGIHSNSSWRVISFGIGGEGPRPNTHGGINKDDERTIPARGAVQLGGDSGGASIEHKSGRTYRDEITRLRTENQELREHLARQLGAARAAAVTRRS